MFFVVNDLLFENNLILSKDIINFLLNRKIWLFNKTTPNVKYISPGDRVIVYVAGRKNKFFSAKFIIDSHLTPNQLDHDTPLEAMLSYNFELQCSIKNLVCLLYTSYIIARRSLYEINRSRQKGG